MTAVPGRRTLNTGTEVREGSIRIDYDKIVLFCNNYLENYTIT